MRWQARLLTQEAKPESRTPTWRVRQVAVILVSLVHSHYHFVIPQGAIDGVNCEFTLPIDYRNIEVVLNGLQQRATKIPPREFILPEPPKPGDYLWCEVIV